MRPERILTAPAEEQHIPDLTTWPGLDAPLLSPTGHTGAYKYQIDNNEAHGWILAAAEETIRSSLFLQHSGIGNGSSGRIYAFGDAAGMAEIVIDESSAELWIIYNGAIVARAGLGNNGPQAAAAWHAIGFYAQTPAAGRPGRISVYHNARRLCTYIGAQTPAAIDRLYFGGGFNGGAWNGPAYVDDLYIDRVPAEADHAPPVLRLDARLANGPGTFTAWTPEPGGNANWQNISDSNDHDGDTSYNHAATVTLQDYFTAPAPAAIAGWEPAQVTIYAYGRDDADAGSVIGLGARGPNGEYNGGIPAALSASYERREITIAEPDPDVDRTWAALGFASIEYGYSTG